MKTPLLLLCLSLAATSVHAAEAFPGLRSVLSAAEWKRAGLDRLTPDEIGVIDAALIRQQAGVVAQVQLAHPLPAPAALPSAPTETAAQNSAPKGWLERFGLPTFNGPDWRSLPPLRAKVVAWEGGNRFKLDNGQVWEGFDPISYDLPGHDVEIVARPNNQFALTVDGQNTRLRVYRLR